MFNLVVMSLMMGLIKYYDKATSKPELQVLLLLDEAGRVRVPNLAQYLATIQGRNIIASLYLQDLHQLKVRYEPEEASSIVGQCKTQVFYPNNSRTDAGVGQRGHRLGVAVSARGR